MDTVDQGQDPYVRYTSTIEVPLGLSVVDAARSSPGPSLVRSFEFGEDPRCRKLHRHPDELLCKGAAAGLDHQGIARHLWVGKNMKGFIGFIEGNLDGDKVLVRIRGAVFIKVAGVSDQHHGHRVYALGPNEFALDEGQGGYLMGVVRFAQPDRKDLASVAFRAFDDKGLLDLKIHGRERPR